MLKTVDLRHTVTLASEHPESGHLEILKGIDLSIEQGETVAIIGASGSGKSTLLGMLAGLDVPSHGEIHINNTNICALNEEQRAAVRSQHVAFVFQNFQLLSSLSALENVMLPLEVKNVDDAREQATSTLQRVGLGERLHHKPQQLSGGEQQRVALARAFACQAPIIFADEPTGNLDTATGEVITDLLFELNQERQTTLVLVTHSPALAKRCQRVLTMQSGSITEAASE